MKPIENIQSKYKYYNSQADKDLSNYSLMVKSEHYTGIPKTYIATGSVITLFLLIFFNVGGEVISNFIGWVYPGRPDILYYYYYYYYYYHFV